MSPFIDQAPIHAEAPLNMDRFLAAIAAVESGGDSRAIGHAGERSAYQITEAVWREETSLPFSRAFNDADAFAVARKHAYTLIWALRGRGITPDVRRLAIAWNGGIEAVILNKFANADVRSYGERVNALYFNIGR